jgi:G3E family GTPase
VTEQASAERIPLSIVTGFLGSGKTTLIAALLKQPAMAGTAVVVNEFGAVGIDDAIFAETLEARDVLLLANGCLCCTAGDDLLKTVWTLTRREADRPRRIVIETTGLADPVPLLHRLMGDPRLRQSTRLDSIVATIDAVNGLRNLDDQAVASRQAAVADRRLITKTDLGEAGDVAALGRRLAALNPGAGVRQVSFGAIDANDLFGASLYDARTGRADVERWLGLGDHRAQPLHRHPHGHIHFSGDPDRDDSIGTWLVEEERPVDWAILSPRLGEIVARHGLSLLRLKGVIQTAGDPRPLVIHGVQRLFHSPVRLDRWPSQPATSIVAIGDRGAAEAIDRIVEALGDAVVDDHAALGA